MMFLRTKCSSLIECLNPDEYSFSFKCRRKFPPYAQTHGFDRPQHRKSELKRRRMNDEQYYDSNLDDLSVLEDLVDRTDTLVNDLYAAGRHRRLLEPSLRHLADAIEELVEHSIYPQLLRRRHAIAAYEDRIAERTMELAPIFAHRVRQLQDINFEREIILNNPLLHELALHEYLRQQLTERFPDADEETLHDTLEGLTNLQEKLSAVVRSQREDETLAEALKNRMDEMQSRLRRLSHRVETKRELVMTVMERAEIDKIVESDFTVSMRRTPPRLIVSDETSIPKEYWKPQAPKLDRRKLTDTLKSGQPVTGAGLDNGGRSTTLRVT